MKPGLTGVRAHAVRAPFERGLPRQRQDRRLARAVGRGARRRHVRRDRRDVDDRAAAAGEHRAAEGARAEEVAAQVHGHDRVPQLERVLVERRPRVDGGVVDEHAARADLGRGGVDSLGVGDVRDDAPSRPARPRARARASASRSSSTTGPRSASRRATAEPRPPAAPVTTAVVMPVPRRGARPRARARRRPRRAVRAGRGSARRRGIDPAGRGAARVLRGDLIVGQPLAGPLAAGHLDLRLARVEPSASVAVSRQPKLMCPARPTSGSVATTVRFRSATTAASRARASVNWARSARPSRARRRCSAAG